MLKYLHFQNMWFIFVIHFVMYVHIEIKRTRHEKVLLTKTKRAGVNRMDIGKQ